MELIAATRSGLLSLGFSVAGDWAKAIGPVAETSKELRAAQEAADKNSRRERSDPAGGTGREEVSAMERAVVKDMVR